MARMPYGRYPYMARRPGLNDMFHAPMYHYPFNVPARVHRFPYEDEPFGDFGEAMGMIPDIEESLDHLCREGILDPIELEAILERIQGIHRHYPWGFNCDGPESYLMARELDRMSRKLQGMYHATDIGQFAMLAKQLMYMGRNVQVGPRRPRFHALPHQRYRPRGLIPPYYGYND
ncbi:hypothetical protein GMOD_00004723 [Pyrenophora seminiperda CCB06]|uniref:Uncharacterized protein n=1 Tax=Pyrenophora seminiperda CCB06 TaxID=1302712 RepID=A0A3M7MHI7_9PLEO|nr:hypothetical protein GMOD_00004723 [Pyrenophora seminiperda CCB06]